MKFLASFWLVIISITSAYAQIDSVSVYHNRAFEHYNRKDYAGCLFWSKKMFQTNQSDYRNNYNLYRVAISACQVNQPAEAMAYFTELVDEHLHYSMYYNFASDSILLTCVRDAEIWKKAIANTKPGYDSAETANELYYEGIMDTTRRLNHSPLLSEQYLANLFTTKSFDKIYQTLKNYHQYETPPVSGHWTLYNIRMNDTLTVPFLVYIPKAYKPGQKTPLYLFLQGAVRGRKQFMVRGNIPVYDSPVLYKAIEKGAFIIYPFARTDVNWLYHPIAFQAILKEIAFVKSLYNIDDNRVYLAGHSNGGEGTFYFAINQPTPFASFLALNYFPQSHITNTLLINLTNNRTFYGVSARKDHIFDFRKVDSIYNYAKGIGCRWQNYSFDGDHGLAYNNSGQIAFTYDTLMSAERHPFPGTIKWETDNVNNGRCDWIEITALDTAANNHRKTGVIEAAVKGNEITIRTSAIKQFSFYVYPELVDITKPLFFVINGKAPRRIQVQKNKEHLKAAFLDTKDRTLLPVQKITIQVDE
ncbi:hypothetical protein GFS24_25110 [Chitinophaga sp. SYP-B3965]|uniref:hypothetical protein n=1 Tax=Chitinophaga sp. SYP-B3965 TaxID=2663120 RepID=UPI001299B161|nr:hypothetical protein [Chitinophaga sp. SYP-B3965]MRG48419.1 hypothetical protein [Chitinophaga sp. SYP-B3965]